MSAFGGVQRRDGSELRPTVGAELLGVTDPDEVVTATVVLRRRVDGARVPSRDYSSPRRIGGPDCGIVSLLRGTGPTRVTSPD